MKGRILWCLHCERVAPDVEWRSGCPYSDCDGGDVDAWDYHKQRLGIEGGPPIPWWPEQPELGARYSLFEVGGQ